MQIKGIFKCPQCQGEFDKCKPSGPDRMWALCSRCDLIVTLEDYNSWQRRMQKYRQNKQYGQNKQYRQTVVKKLEECEEAKVDFKEKIKRVFNPTKR